MSTASVDQLRKPRTRTVSVDVDGERAEFVISKLKAGQRKRIQAECVDEYGILDLEAVARLSVELCTVTPELSADDVEHIDADVLLALANLIAEHSNLHNITKLAQPDPEEGSDAVKSFPAAGGSSVVGERVDADPAGA